jgi:hypothetical protein
MLSIPVISAITARVRALCSRNRRAGVAALAPTRHDDYVSSGDSSQPACRDGVPATAAAYVELAHHDGAATGEAFVEAVRRTGDRVEVAVLLADGSDATASLDVAEWDWLDARPGDIVRVRRVCWAGLSA